MGNEASIDVRVNTGNSSGQLDGVAQSADAALQAIDQLSGKPISIDAADAVTQLNSVGDAADEAAEKIERVSNKPIKVDASYSIQQLQDMADSVNAFTQEIGKKLGKPVKLLDVAENAADLKKLIDDFQEVIRLSTTVRGPLNQNNQGPGNRPATPVQIDQTLRQNSNYMQATMARLMLHNASSGGRPADVGLDYQELTGRTRSPPNPEPSQEPKKRPAQNDSHFGQIAQQAVAGLQSAGPVGGMAAAAATGATKASDNGLGMMGVLKGGGVAALAYGAFQAVSSAGGAVMDKMDAGKTENIELDKFKRSIGTTSDGFQDLKDNSRKMGEQFLLTYEQSRKLGMDFATQARSNVNGSGLAGVGIDLAQSAGVDEAQGTSYMATMRRSGNLGEKTLDAKIMAVQFAEALKRTGSTLNAGDLMQAMGGFASGTAQRSLGVANVDGFAGLLSAMVGSNTPGLAGNVGNSANLLNRADAAFQGGGGMGEASNTLQFMAMGGDKVGLLGIKMRQAAGMFATGQDVFGNKEGQVNKFLGGDGMTKLGGQKSGFEQTLDMFDRRGVSKETQLLSAANHFKMNPEEMATLFNLREEKKLGGLQAMLGQYKGVVDPIKLSSAGLMSMADIQRAGLDSGKLGGVRDQMAAREGLTKEQKVDLDRTKTISDPKQLQDALVKVANTFEREKTAGEQAQESAAKTAQATARLVDGLIKPAQESRNFLAALVETLAPDTAAGKSMRADAQQKAATSNMDKRHSRIESGQVSILDREADYASRIRIAKTGPDSKSRVAAIEKEREAELGFMGGKGAGDAISYFMGKKWTRSQAEGITANFQAESNFNPNAKGDEVKGKFTATGAMQWHKDRADKFQEKYGHPLTGAPLHEQYDFFDHELRYGQEKATGDRLLKTKTAAEAGSVVVDAVRPKDIVGEKQRRAAIAERYSKIQIQTASLVPSGKSMAPAMNPLQTPKAADKAPAALPPTFSSWHQQEMARNNSTINFSKMAPIDINGVFTLNNGSETQTQQVNRSLALKPQASGGFR